MKKFVGRRRELEKLSGLLDKDSASLVVIKGRRRIGKSRLAEEFSKQFPVSYIITGLPPEKGTTAAMERGDFAAQLQRVAGIKGIKTDEWGDLFWHLAQVSKKGRVLVVLDEINWMGSNDPTFLGKLKSAWDLYFKSNSKLVMILSGSMSAWIERNILSATGFMGRISLDLTLKELLLHQCNEFLNLKSKHAGAYEKFKLLSVVGGVPRYLEEINPKMTAEENIQSMAFTSEGILFNEFDRIFSDLFFKRSELYKDIVERLAYGSADFKEIAKSLGLQKSGTLSVYLDDLVETGYLSRDFTWHVSTGKESKLSVYRLSDNYLRFYLRYILPNKEKIKKGRINSIPAWHSIMGLQFENLVINNYASLGTLLHIKPEEIIIDGPYFQRPTKEHRGCQIDYMVQTKFNTLYVFEIKFSKSLIGMSVIKEVEDKIAALKFPKGYSYRPVLIHVNGVSDDLKESDYFSAIIDFSDFLKICNGSPNSFS